MDGEEARPYNVTKKQKLEIWRASNRPVWPRRHWWVASSASWSTRAFPSRRLCSRAIDQLRSVSLWMSYRMMPWCQAASIFLAVMASAISSVSISTIIFWKTKSQGQLKPRFHNYAWNHRSSQLPISSQSPAVLGFPLVAQSEFNLIQPDSCFSHLVRLHDFGPSATPGFYPIWTSWVSDFSAQSIISLLHT